MTYLNRGLKECAEVFDSYRKWSLKMQDEISKETYRSRLEVLAANRMPNIDLKVPMDEYEPKTEIDPNEW